MKKNYIKWGLLAAFISAGILVITLAPSAALSMLPEAETTKLIKHNYSKTVRGGGIITGSQEQGFMLTVAIREGDINEIHEGQSAQLYGDAIGDGKYIAFVHALADFAEQREVGGITETVVGVILKLDNPDELIRPGYTAEALIKVSEAEELLLVPYKAINQDESDEFVYVLQGNTAVRRIIKTGLELVEGTVLVDGLHEGDELVVNPERYTENMLLRVA